MVYCPLTVHCDTPHKIQKLQDVFLSVMLVFRSHFKLTFSLTLAVTQQC